MNTLNTALQELLTQLLNTMFKLTTLLWALTESIQFHDDDDDDTDNYNGAVYLYNAQ